MKKEKTKHAAEYWFSMLQQFSTETNGFKLELSGLTDAELISLKWVIPPFLDLAPAMFGAVKPKHHPDLRRSIAYIADLYERQAAARERVIEKNQNRMRELARVIKILNNAPMVNLEKINLVKEHFGWE